MIFRSAVRSFDGLVRRLVGVVEFTDDPDCLLRLRAASASHPLRIGDATLPAGCPVLEIHLWNEHLPPMPQAGPDVPWAAKTARLFLRSMRLLADHVRTDPRLAACRAIGGSATLADDPAARSLLHRLGFILYEAPSTIGLGRWWKSAYARALVWAFNPPSLRAARKSARIGLWMTMESFLARYGSKHPPTSGRGSREG